MSRDKSGIKVIRELVDESEIEVIDITRGEYAGEYKIYLAKK